MVSFVFTNPRHHLDAMGPVAEALRARGVDAQLISLAELRGFRTPKEQAVRALPPFRKSPSVGRGMGSSASDGMSLGQSVLWSAALRPRLKWLLRGSQAVVVPNDTAWPYGPLCAAMRRRERPFFLMQEGIRFPLPGESGRGEAYGGAGATGVCVWGEASAEHFRTVAPPESVVVTGTPRFDALDPERHGEAARSWLAQLGLERPPVVFLSNPIDDMGFCSNQEKMDLFESFLRTAAPLLRERGHSVVAKLHPSEDLAAFRATADRVDGIDVHVVDAPLTTVLAGARAAVVLASTVGLEAMMFEVPVGVLALPRYGHVFEYVSRGAAVALEAENAAGLSELLDSPPGTNVVRGFVERHVAHRGHSADRVAECIIARLQQTPLAD